MLDYRGLKRRHLIYYLRIFDRNTAKLIGHMVDITTKGMMIIGEEPIKIDIVYNLGMEISSLADNVDQIEFNARCLRYVRDVNPDFYNYGFEIVNIDLKAVELIQQLIYQFGFND